MIHSNSVKVTLLHVLILAIYAFLCYVVGFLLYFMLKVDFSFDCLFVGNFLLCISFSLNSHTFLSGDRLP